MSDKPGHGWLWWVGGLALALVIGGVVILSFSRTNWGRERVLEFTVQALGRKLQGSLEIARADGNLLDGARVYGIAVRGNDGVPLLVADSGYVDYNVRTLMSDRTVIDRVVLHNPRVFVRILPGDSLWNFQEIFRDTAQQAPGTRTTVVERVDLRNGHVTIEMPWEPEPELRGRARERAIREALADTLRLMVRRAPGGYLQTMRMERVNGGLRNVVLGPEAGGGVYTRIHDLSGSMYAYREPAHIRRAWGEVSVREGVTEFRADTLVFPRSRVTGFGTVRSGKPQQYDLFFRTDTAALGDFQWLYPGFPERGGGTLKLRFEVRSDGTLLHIWDARVSAPGTRVRGSFGVLFGDTIRFVDVGLTADPLDVRTVERMLPTGLPVRGLRIGGVEIRESRP